MVSIEIKSFQKTVLYLRIPLIRISHVKVMITKDSNPIEAKTDHFHCCSAS